VPGEEDVAAGEGRREVGRDLDAARGVAAVLAILRDDLTRAGWGGDAVGCEREGGLDDDGEVGRRWPSP
jgi:hypothetical protein